MVSIIIVNWNGMSVLPDCLAGIDNQSYTDHDTIVVDNGSTDGSIRFIKENFFGVRIIPLPGNFGFSTANHAP